MSDTPNNQNLVPNNENSFNSIGFFDNGDHFVFAFKKTEKIVHAMYLVTNHLPESEPLKNEVREIALSFLSDSLIFNGVEIYDENSIVVSYFSSALRSISLLKLASISANISLKNSNLIINEIESLVAFLKAKLKENNEKSGFILSKDFFATVGQGDFSKGHSQNLPPKSSSQLKSEGNLTTSKNALKEGLNVKDKKNSRQEGIIDLLKKESNLTTKDFLKVIHGCSEKTIQRELTHLVEKGIVKKEGERRWSRYSLK